ncbi:phage terminase small subunit P27 family, partial [Staphylococcus saprophyticus]
MKITKQKLKQYLDNYQESDDMLISLYIETYE